MSALTVSLLSGRGVSTKPRTSNDSSSSVSMRKHYQRRNSLHHPTTTKNHHPRATPDQNWIKNNNKNSANNVQKSSKVRSNSPSFGGSSVLEDFDGQKPEIATTTRRSSTVNNPLRESKSRAENAMRARQFFNNKQSSSYANGGSAAFGSMVPEDEEASTSGQQELQQQQQQQQQLEKQEREEQMSDIKKRMMVALECERQDLADGSVLFSFSEKPLTRQQKAALAAEEEKLQITSSDFERQPNFIERWFMTVRFQAATVSVEKAFFFVLSTPFRMVFWTFAYAMRLLFWIVTGRFSNLLFSLNKGKRRASKQLAANYSQMEIEKQRKEKMERERAFVEGSAKVARERLQL
ncbi:unnamed protein product [Bathycoccus prasinos]|jgi:hypothetical protein